MRRIKIAKILRNESDFLAKYFLSKLSEIPNFNTDKYNRLSENENETWRAPHHGENESVLGSECLKKYESRIIIGRYDVSVKLTNQNAD